MLYDSSLNSMNVCHLFDRSFCASLHRWCVDSLHVTVRGMREGWRTYGLSITDSCISWSCIQWTLFPLDVPAKLPHTSYL